MKLETALSLSQPSFWVALADPTELESPPPPTLPCDLGQPHPEDSVWFFLSHTQKWQRVLQPGVQEFEGPG